jgi:hypothetical protein
MVKARHTVLVSAASHGGVAALNHCVHSSINRNALKNEKTRQRAGHRLLVSDAYDKPASGTGALPRGRVPTQAYECVGGGQPRARPLGSRAINACEGYVVEHCCLRPAPSTAAQGGTRRYPARSVLIARRTLRRSPFLRDRPASSTTVIDALKPTVIVLNRGAVILRHADRNSIRTAPFS